MVKKTQKAMVEKDDRGLGWDKRRYFLLAMPPLKKYFSDGAPFFKNYAPKHPRNSTPKLIKGLKINQRSLIIILVWVILFTGSPLSLWNPIKNVWALSTPQFCLQVASLSTEREARGKIERLTSINIQAQYFRRQDRSKKTWFVVTIGGYKTKKEAVRYGNQLIRKGIIRSFKVIPKKNEIIPTKAKEVAPSPLNLPTKELKQILEEKPVYFGPIAIKEEENGLRINISIDKKIFPIITNDKVADGSRLIVTFENIDRHIVPFSFDKVQSNTLLSFNLFQRGTDCVFILLLSSAYNYEVTRDYYEKEKLYSMVIKREPTSETKQVIEE